jgi:hypothetical protein
MQFVKASLVYLILGALIAAGIVVMAAKGSFSLLILSVALFMGLFIKYGCLTSND